MSYPKNSFFKPIFALLKKDLLLEWRQKHTLYGVLLYVGGTVFLINMMAGQPGPEVWNVLFWLTQLFVTVNAIAKSFLQESPARFRYYYTIVKPSTFIIAKLIYSTLLMLGITLLTLLLFQVLLGFPLAQPGLFVGISLVGGFSLSILYTFLSAISARAHQNAALMAILGFPLAAPLLSILSKLAIVAISPVYTTGWQSLLGILLALDVLIMLLSILLFPFLWEE